MSFKKVLLPVALSFLLLGAGCSFTQTVNKNTNTVNENVSGEAGSGSVGNQNVNAVSSVTYAGQEGKNALELLQSDHETDVSDQGFVNAIDGVEPGNQEFWAFYVNGEQAQVGAKDYITKDGDEIEWKLEGF